jgi:hypothetical protein
MSPWSSRVSLLPRNNLLRCFWGHYFRRHHLLCKPPPTDRSFCRWISPDRRACTFPAITCACLVLRPVFSTVSLQLSLPFFFLLFPRAYGLCAGEFLQQSWKPTHVIFPCAPSFHQIWLPTVVMLIIVPIYVSRPPQLQKRLHRQTAMESLPWPKHSRTMLEKEWIKWLWRKFRMPQTWCLLHLSSILFSPSRPLLYFLFCFLESQGKIGVV